MKNKYKIFTIIFLIFFFKISNLYSDEFKFESSEIQILDNGNLLKAKNGVKIISDDGVIINADKVEYNKISLKLIAEGEVKIFDTINEINISAPKIIYHKDKDVIYSEGKTDGIIKKIYNLETKNIILDRKNMQAISKNKTTIFDDENNFFISKEFKYLMSDKLIKVDELEFINSINDKFFFKDAFVNINTNEIIGRDISIKFHNSAFNDQENEPRLKGNTAYSNKNKTKITKGVFTTCKKRDGCPPWLLTAEEVEHDKLKKTINYKNAWLKVYDIPVLYFPKFFHPDPTVKRQSGFLMPKFSDSRSLGSSLDVPYYHVISHSKDLTFKPRIYSDRKFILQSEYRSVKKLSKHILDFSFMKGHESAEAGTGDTRSHFFSNSIIDLNLSTFDFSQMRVNLEKSSNDNYLKIYKLDSPIINNFGYHSSSFDFEANNEDLSIKTSFEVFEHLNKLHSDRYEFVYPSFDITKNISTNEKINGNLSLNANGYQKLHSTNVSEKVLINDLLYESNPIISSNGLKNKYSFLFKNVNSDAENSSRYMDSTDNQFLGLAMLETTYPLKKSSDNSDNFLTPKISLRYSPTPTRNIKDEDRRLDINNIFSLNRIGANDTIEGGGSLTLGAEYKKTDKINNDIFTINLAKMYRHKVNEDLPTKSTLGDKDSDIVGNLKIIPNKLLDIDYSFSLDNNMETANYHLLKTGLTINNFVTSFEFLEENNFVGKESYVENKTSYNFKNNTSLSFSTRKNKRTDLTEFYNLIYEYKNDCLVAAVKYNKEYYDDKEIKPEESIFFSLTIKPFGKANSPNLNQ